MTNRKKLASSIALAMMLGACGGGSGGDSASKDYPGHGDVAPLKSLDRSALSFSIQASETMAQTKDTLPCYRGEQAPASCDLRVYQVMVESFIDGDSNHDYNAAYGSSSHKGDLQGIIDAIPYIVSTGSNALWLTPIFHSIPVSSQNEWADRLDGTGYFTSDYFAIDPNFGTEAQFAELVEKAHEAGLYVFLDGVFGHHKGNVKASPNGLLPTGSPEEVDYPGVDNATLEFYKEVATYWVNEYQIDGWRLDQAYQVPVEFWSEIRQAVESASSDAQNAYQLNGQTQQPLAYMVAEIWRGESEIAAAGYGDNASPALLSAFDFPMRYRLVQTLAGEESGIGDKAASNLNSGFLTHANYPEHAQPNLMLTNHDLVRFGDLLQRAGLANPSDEDYWGRHRAAFAFMAAYSGPLTLYYGDEIGDQVADFYEKIDCDNDNGRGARAGYCDDHVSRNAAQIEGLASVLGDAVFTPSAEQAALKAYVAKLFALRDTHSALASGSRTHLFANDYLYIDRKDSADESLLFMLNAKPKALSVSIDAKVLGSIGDLSSLLDGKRYSLESGIYSFELAPFEALFLSIDEPSEIAPYTGVSSDDGAVSGGALDSEMARCDLPELQSGPLEKRLYLRGSWSDSEWEAVGSRAFTYRGDDLYQVVVNESIGSYIFQLGEADWGNQRSLNGTLALESETPLKAGGYDLNTSLDIPSKGEYVYAIRVKDGLAQSIQVSACP